MYINVLPLSVCFAKKKYYCRTHNIVLNSVNWHFYSETIQWPKKLLSHSCFSWHLMHWFCFKTWLPTHHLPSAWRQFHQVLAACWSFGTRQTPLPIREPRVASPLPSLRISRSNSRTPWPGSRLTGTLTSAPNSNKKHASYGQLWPVQVENHEIPRWNWVSMTGCSMMFMLHPPAVRMAHDGTIAGPRPGGPGVRGVLPTCYSFCASAPGGMPEASHNSELHTAHHGTMIWRIRTGQLVQTFSDTSASEIPALLGMTTSQHLYIIYI